MYQVNSLVLSNNGVSLLEDMLSAFAIRGQNNNASLQKLEQRST